MVSKMAAAAFAAVVIGGLYMHHKTPRGIRNNNPLNIRISADAWQGATGDDGEFVTFETPFYGLRAAARTLRTYADKHGIKTVKSILHRWAPPTENDTESYIRSVTSKTGLSPDDKLYSATDYQRLLTAMIYHENGQQPYDEMLIKDAVIKGLYA